MSQWDGIGWSLGGVKYIPHTLIIRQEQQEQEHQKQQQQKDNHACLESRAPSSLVSPQRKHCPGFPGVAASWSTIGWFNLGDDDGDDDGDDGDDEYDKDDEDDEDDKDDNNDDVDDDDDNHYENVDDNDNVDKDDDAKTDVEVSVKEGQDCHNSSVI